MSKYDISIDLTELDNSIHKIDKDLINLEIEMNNINDAYLYLDESKWMGLDKKKIDNGFGDYLKKMTNFSNDLRSTLNVLKTAYSKYEEIEIKQNKDIQELEEL